MPTLVAVKRVRLAMTVAIPQLCSDGAGRKLGSQSRWGKGSMKTGLLIIGGMFFLGATHTEVSAQKRRIPARRSMSRPPPLFDPKTYANSVADVDCSNVVQRYQGVVPFEKVARSIVENDAKAVLTKDEFETSEAFNNRASATYRTWLGGTDKVVLALPLGDWQLKYDADASSLKIGSPFSRDYYGNSQTNRNELADFMVELFRDAKDGQAYSAQNAYGAVVDVSVRSTTRGALLFKLNGSYERNITGAANYNVSMSPDSARAFKAAPVMLILGKMATTFLDRSSDVNRPTISDPERHSTASYGFHIIPQCIIFAHPGVEVARVNGL